jgi:hypothetical protein
MRIALEPRIFIVVNAAFNVMNVEAIHQLASSNNCTEFDAPTELLFQLRIGFATEPIPGFSCVNQESPAIASWPFTVLYALLSARD